VQHHGADLFRVTQGVWFRYPAPPVQQHHSPVDTASSFTCAAPLVGNFEVLLATLPMASSVPAATLTSEA